MRTEDGPKGRATKRFSAAREVAASREARRPASPRRSWRRASPRRWRRRTSPTTRDGGGRDGTAMGRATARAAAGGALGTGPPELVFEPDPETRRRIQMAAESDLEASRYAHWRGTVTFHDVANTWFNMSDPNLSSELRAEFKTIFPGLLDAFAEPRKGIITAYFCRHIRVAAALTDIGHAAGAPEGVPEATLKGPPPAGIEELLTAADHERARDSGGHGDLPEPGARRSRSGRSSATCLHLFDPAPASSSAIHIEPTFGDPADWKAKEILFHCMNLHYKALEFLTPQPRKICMRMIFGVIATLLGTLDARALDQPEATCRSGPIPPRSRRSSASSRRRRRTTGRRPSARRSWSTCSAC